MTTVNSETLNPSLLRSVLSDGIYNVPDHDTKIFKDECMYCFHNPFFTGGLYVCLKTFTCFCERHVHVFAVRSGSSLFLQIESWKIPIGVETNNGEPKDKITRLAIGLDSGFDNQKYELKEVHHIVTYPNLDKRWDVVRDLGEDFYDVCQLVINSTSAERLELLQNASNAWDGEIKQITKHANIQQLSSGKKVELSGWKCEADGCDLTENLWLNLTDGSIRCGRSQFVAEGEISKGNNHMKQYYDATGFPLVVKLGTISMEGTADVYSYDEDDAVIDPNLDKHLAHFGIDPSRLKKTEKSTLEMELDMNQKWEWAKCQEDGASLESIFGPGYTGLINIGSSCYMNSVLQSLLLIPDFRLRFCDGAAEIFSQLPSFEVHNDFNSQVAKLFSALMSGDYAVESSDTERNGVKPLQFKRVVAGSHVEFSTARQQDAEEYVRFLFDRILSNTPAGVDDPTYSMRFKVETRFEDISSGRVRYSDRDEMILAVPVPQSALRPIEDEENRFSVSMSECLNTVFSPEIIEGFTSPITGESKGASNTIRFKTFPDFLMIQIQKFTMAPDFTVKKLDINLQVEEELDLSCFRGVGKKESEQLLPSDVFVASPSLPEYDKNIATQLEAMGFSHNASVKAVIETHSSGVEAAAEWVMMRLDDPTLNDPPQLTCGVTTVNSDESTNIEQLVAFGFTIHQARYALQRNTDANAAAEWLFLNAHEVPAESPSNIDSISNTVREMKDGGEKYKLVGFISHMGSSPHSGHYVAHIKKDGKWILFNDEKVAISQHPPKQLAYLYLYKRLE